MLTAWLGSQVRFTSDTRDILPSDDALRETLDVAQQFTGAKLALVEVDGTGVDRSVLADATNTLAEQLAALDSIESVRVGFDSADGLAIATRIGPYSTGFLPGYEVRERTQPEAIAATLRERKSQLKGIAGMFLVNAVRDDPLDLRTAATKHLADNQPGVSAVDGMLLDATGTRALLIVTSALHPSDVGPHDPRVAAIDDVVQNAPLPAIWTGGIRIAYETASHIERDVRVTASLGMGLLAIVLFIGFRSWRPLVGAVLPAVTAAGCAWAGAWWASPIHGLQLGFSAALAGLAVDYWVHLYLACAAEPDQHDFQSRYRASVRALSKLTPALLVSAGSTALAFGLLTTSALPIVRVLGITGAAAAIGALLGTLLAGPLAWAMVGRPADATRSASVGRFATPIVLGIVALALVGSSTRFEPDPMALIATSAEADESADQFADRYGLTMKRGLVLIEEPTIGESLDQAARVQEAIDNLGFVKASGPAGLLPGPRRVDAARRALPDVEALQRSLDEAAAAVDLPPFEGAAQRIHDRATPPPVDLWEGTPLSERVTVLGNQILISVPLQDDTVIPALEDALFRVDPDIQLVVPGLLAAESMAETRSALLQRALVGGLLIFVVLAIRHRSPGRSVLALLPAGASVAGAAGVMTLFGEPWNPVSLAAMVPVLGLAVDYGVFMTESGEMESSHGDARRLEMALAPELMEGGIGRGFGRQGPRRWAAKPSLRGGVMDSAPRAVRLSAATTLAGFATLALADSPALFGVGVATVAGVGSAAVVALVVLPVARHSEWPGPRASRALSTAVMLAAIFLHGDLLLHVVGVFSPPAPGEIPDGRLEVTPGERRFGSTRLVRDDGIWLLATDGDPYGAGYAAGVVTSELRPRLEEELFESFERQVPYAAARWLITRGSVIAGMGLESHMTPSQQLEILGTADAVEEPYWFAGPLYTRKVYYHAIHDLGQALVDSPLLACTGIVAGPEMTVDGHWLLARNFDFEGGVAFDRDKIVRIHRPDDGHAYLSIGFTGMIGAVSGVNEHGLAVAINAGGSDAPPRPGTPMTLIVREILQFADSVDDARQILENRTGFVSENVIVVDAKNNRAALFEVSPATVEVLPVERSLAVTNHFRTPAFADDATNQARQANSTTKVRLERAEELLARHDGSLDMRVASDILRDRSATGDRPLARGHRHALNADIATHGVVIDATTQTVWVSRFPNVSAGFVEVSLQDALKGRLKTERRVDPEPHAERAIAMRAGRQLLRRARRVSTAEALPLTERALRAMPDHPEALYERGRVLMESGETEAARPLLERALAGPPEYAYQVKAIEKLLERR